MKAYLLIFAPVFLLPCWMLLAGCVDEIPLDMAPKAVDDMYLGCTEKMEEKVNKTYSPKEYSGIQFKTTWTNAEICEKTTKDKGDEALTKNHLRAICAYTSNNIYAQFNEAVRTGRSSYGSSFKYHSLHFWLTTAIKTLNSKQHCHTKPTYRRTDIVFTGEVNKIIRFGMFASSSYRTDLKHFGKATCFKIVTCHGAYLKKYSTYDEEEVLIPPYEQFLITNVYNGLDSKVTGLEDCKKVFDLESVGCKSNLNCKAI